MRARLDVPLGTSDFSLDGIASHLGDNKGIPLPVSLSLNYKWKQIGGQKVTLLDANSVGPKVLLDSINSGTDLTFQLTVNDGYRDSNPSSVTIHIIESSNGAKTFVVNTNAIDNIQCSPTHCSLEEAIKEADNNPGRDTINFNLPASETTITLSPSSIKDLYLQDPLVKDRTFHFGGLTKITDPVIIDGTSQPGYNGKPVVRIYGGDTPLVIYSSDTVVKGLIIDGYTDTGISIGPKEQVDNTGSNSYTITAEPTSGNVIEGNYIGTDPDGSGSTEASSFGSKIGVNIYASSDNRIGGYAPSERNVISANNQFGIRISFEHAQQYVISNIQGNNFQSNLFFCNNVECASNYGLTSADNLIQGNYMGTDSTGENPLPNGDAGIAILDSNNSLVGGVGQEARNIISGNGKDGIVIAGTWSN